MAVEFILENTQSLLSKGKFCCSMVSDHSHWENDFVLIMGFEGFKTFKQDIDTQ